MKKRILLTYAMYGNGHRAIAEYIESYFKKEDPELEILAIDLLKYSTPILGRLSQKVTDFFLLKFPFGWSIIYNLFDTKLSSAIANRTSMNLFKNKRMKKIITDFNPDLTISTHFFGSSLIDFYNRKGITHSKLITVVTDYEAHALWLRGYKREQAIIVGDKDEVKYLVKKGVDRHKIKPIGIPINPVTSTDFDVLKATEKYGFDGSRPICLFFGGGGNGGTLSLPYIRKIIKNNLNIDFIYVAGKNQNAKAKVDKWIEEYQVKNIKTLGFVNNVPELLQICDFVVSKPGGAQTTESLYFKKPIIMINCSGGQEVANFKYFEKNSYGKRFRTSFMFYRYMKKISENPSIIDEMKKNMSKNKNHEAMEKLYKLAIKILNQ
ncbi:MAG TPA: glycosyltransferase [Candidatus Coprovivens excrementavium]|nr:glycosyltransferase [Candidatus Coprovivens excrementavium]